MNTPFNPVPLLFLTPPDSDLSGFLQEAHRLVEREPEIIERIDVDLDRHGQEKKALRLQDAQWWQARTLGLPTIPWEPATVKPEELRLEDGRPRTPAYVVYMFLVGRGFYGGFKSAEATTLLLESTTLTVFLMNQGLSMPGRSTLNELVNAVSNDTRERILDAQLRMVLGEGWDNLASLLLVDSTAVAGNTQWPTDSKLMVDLVARVLRRGQKLERLRLAPLDAPGVDNLLRKMRSLHKQISMGAGKPGSERARKKLYTKLLCLARKALARLELPVHRAEQALAALDVAPSRRQMAARLVGWLRTDLGNLGRVIECCQARVLQGRKVAVQEKVLSVSDPDVGFIAKGGRESVVGYKPQIGRTGGGFVVGLIVPQGNEADSGQLVPMFDQVVGRTGVVPRTVSVDDGYSSRKGREQLRKRGVKVVSISGAKGKNITPVEDWDDPEYVAARNGRSAIESLMFTLKHGFDFGRVARRGLDNVRAEMLEKALAYNFCRMATCRRAAADTGQRLVA